jgi:glycosyltransferase involved in cell wall biosynthesis
MNIAFVSTRKDIGGVTVYISRLMTGVEKIGHKCYLVIITRGNGDAHVRAWTRFGRTPAIIVRKPEQITETLNKFDMIVYDMPGGFDDHRHYKEYGKDSLPWFYDGIQHVTKPQTALLLDTKTLTKWCPYISVWEQDICDFFISIKTGLSELYQKERGVLDTYTVDVPISVDETDLSRFGERPRLIISTNRIYPEKRLKYLVDTMPCLPDWRAELHSGAFFFHYAKNLLKDASTNVTWDKSTGIDLDIYYGSALTYAASDFGPGSDGGMECVALEGAVRGSVPLLSDNWVAPNPDSPPEDAVYKFSINGSECNIYDVISNIDPRSKDYVERQRSIFEYIRENKRDTTQARKLLWLCREVAQN